MDHQRLLAKRQQLIKVKLAEIFRKDLAIAAFSRITITNIILSRSLESAKVYYIPFPGEDAILAKEIVRKKGFLQHKLNQALQVKKSPKLDFIYDKGAIHADRIDNILREVRSKDNAQ